jgi:bacterioferritin (cytochrome b1)
VIEHNLHGVLQLLEESLKFEEEAIAAYKKLVKLATELGDIALEEMARGFVKNEVEHADEVRKMMRKPEGA